MSSSLLLSRSFKTIRRGSVIYSRRLNKVSSSKFARCHKNRQTAEEGWSTQKPKRDNNKDINPNIWNVN